MNVTLINDTPALEALGGAWTSLQRHCARPSIFLGHDWHCAAWQWRRRSARLNVLACQRQGALVGVLPLVRPGPDEASPGRTLEFLTVPDTQWGDVLAARGEEDAVTAALCDELERTGADWDVLRLPYLAPGALAAMTLRREFERRGHTVCLEPAGDNPSVALAGTWDAYYATRSRSLKKASNLAANRLARAGAIEVTWIEPGRATWAAVETALEAVIALSAASWKTRTGNSLENAGPQSFIRDLARRAHARGALSIWLLHLDGAAKAMELQLVADGCVFALRSDFDASMEALSPGSHLSRTLLERLFERGWSTYFMGPGGNPYKYRWADGGTPVASLSVYSRSLRGRALASWERSLKPAARQLRDALFPPTRPPQRSDSEDNDAARG